MAVVCNDVAPGCLFIGYRCLIGYGYLPSKTSHDPISRQAVSIHENHAFANHVVPMFTILPVFRRNNVVVVTYYISLHGVVTLGYCQRYGVHYRLLSTCVGSFICPGIDTQVQGSPLQATVHMCGIFYLPWHRHIGTRITIFSLIRQTLFLFTIVFLPRP
jgi:hypothetical protein